MRDAGRAVADGVRNPRHNLEAIGALLLGTQIAATPEGGELVRMLEALGLPPEAITIAGLLAVVVARVMSWKNRRKEN